MKIYKITLALMVLANGLVEARAAAPSPLPASRLSSSRYGTYISPLTGRVISPSTASTVNSSQHIPLSQVVTNRAKPPYETFIQNNNLDYPVNTSYDPSRRVDYPVSTQEEFTKYVGSQGARYEGLSFSVSRIGTVAPSTTGNSNISAQTNKDINREQRAAAQTQSQAVSWANTSDGHIAVQEANREERAENLPAPAAISWANTVDGHIAEQEANRQERADRLNGTDNGQLSNPPHQSPWSNLPQGLASIKTFNDAINASSETFANKFLLWSNTALTRSVLAEFDRQVKAAIDEFRQKISATAEPDLLTTIDGLNRDLQTAASYLISATAWASTLEGHLALKDYFNQIRAAARDLVRARLAFTNTPMQQSISMKFDAIIFKEELAELQQGTPLSTTLPNNAKTIQELRSEIEEHIQEKVSEQVEAKIDNSNLITTSPDDVLRLEKGVIVPKIRTKNLQLYPSDQAPTNPSAGEIYYNKNTGAICVWLEDELIPENSGWKLLTGIDGAYCP